MVTPVFGRRMVGIRPYFFRMGQFCAGTRSKPLHPRLAASRQTSSNGIFESNTPRVRHCFKRPLRGTGAGAWAEATVAAARPVTKSLRRIGGLYRRLGRAVSAHFFSNDTPQSFLPLGHFPFDVFAKSRINQRLVADFTARPIGDRAEIIQEILVEPDSDSHFTGFRRGFGQD